MTPTTLAENLGKGLFAGLVGTAAMTVSSTIEARIRRRGASSAPADAAAKVLGIEKFVDAAAERRFGTLVHWGYGTGWGAARGALRTVGLSSTFATLSHFGAMWGGAVGMLPALGVAPPITRWGRTEIAIDVWHHLVYVVATAAAYELLDG